MIPAGRDVFHPMQLAQMDADLDRLLAEKPQIDPEGPHHLPDPVDAQPKPLPHPDTQGPSRLAPFALGVVRRWPMGGWVYHDVAARMQREDQGQDLEVPLGRHIVAPGWGHCIRHLSDGDWPHGFGSPYAVVYIGSGRFARKLMYLGHCNAEVVPVGHHFHTGAVLARPNHSLNAGWGWAEIGWAPGGFPGRWGNGALLHHLFTPVWRRS
jgi:hypothetical protein